MIEPDLPDNRLNEGRVAPDGSFWVGTMQNNITGTGGPKATDRDSGAIYRVASDGSVIALTPREFGITNTMAWTSDGRFLTADTPKNALYAYDIRKGSLVNKQVFAAPLERGLPDGSCLDESDNLWNCRVVDGAGVARFRPDGGLGGVVDLPCSWPTSCAFGGPSFDRLFVTSARFTMSPERLAANPLEGGLFELNVGCRGRSEPRFGPQ